MSVARPSPWRLVAALVAGLGAASTSAVARQPVEIRQAPGENALVNGVYYPTSTSYFGLPCYHKLAGEDVWLCPDPNGFWNAQPAAQRGTGNGYMISNLRKQQSPEQAGPWRLWAESSWKVFPEVAVAAQGQPGPAPPGPALPPQRPEGRPVAQPAAARPGAQPEEEEKASRITWAVAVMLFGYMGTIMVVLALVNSTDPHIRSYIYKMVSTTLTIFVGVLVTKAVTSVLFEQLLPAPWPRGLSLGYPIRPWLQIAVAALLFTFLSWALVFLGWKFQYSRPRLVTLRTLGGHLCAFLAIFLSKQVLVQAVQLASLRGQPTAAEHLPTVTFVVVLGWCVLALYRQASACLRAGTFRSPPFSPWPAAQRFVVLEEKKTHRGCDFATRAAEPSEAKVESYDWEAYVAGAEDEVAVCVVAFIINEAIIFVWTGLLPGLQHDENVYAQALVDRWWWALAIALAVNCVLLYARAAFGDGGRPGQILQRIAVMTVSWCLFRLGDWQTRLYFEGDLALAQVVAAFIITAFAVSLTLILDHAADLLGRLAPSLAKYRDLQGSSEETFAGQALRSVILSFGFLVGISWSRAYDVALETLVDSTAGLRDHVVLSKAALSVLVACLVVRPWRKYLLPKAEMTPGAHEESIEHELFQMDRAEGLLAPGTTHA